MQSRSLSALPVLLLLTRAPAAKLPPLAAPRSMSPKRDSDDLPRRGSLLFAPSPAAGAAAACGCAAVGLFPALPDGPEDALPLVLNSRRRRLFVRVLCKVAMIKRGPLPQGTT